MKCIKGYEIKVLRSGAGYYLGTTDKEGFPNCRMSTNYYKTETLAAWALLNNVFSERECIENVSCNNGAGCFNISPRGIVWPGFLLKTKEETL